ncbi:MAG: S41 family peptidase [Mycobacteriales bacterium]
MRNTLLAAGALSLAAVSTVAALSTAKVFGATDHPTGAPVAPCTKSTGTPPPLAPTTASTIAQAYDCIYAHYFDAPHLDDRALLVSAFAAFTQELNRRGIDQPTATLPALTGRRDADISAFAAVYQRVIDRLPNDEATRQAVGEATIRGLVAGLHQNHIAWVRGAAYQLQVVTGMSVSGGNGPGASDPAAVAPLFVKTVEAGGPAANAGIKAGDEITSINGVTPFINGKLDEGVWNWIAYPEDGVPVRLALHRPATGQTLNVTLTPHTQSGPPAGPSAPPSKVLDGDVGYVQLSGFFTGPTGGAADAVLTAINNMRKQATLRGIILDLRGNGGGSAEERAKLLGMLAHHKITSYECDSQDHCTPNRTDDSMPLVGLPFVVLTDRDCASACDSFTSTVKDLHLGTIVGTRTAGVVAGIPSLFNLNDGSGLQLTTKYEVGADHELINGVGVAPDQYAPVTAASLSAGHDLGLEKALSLLH